ncbi:MAG TPA: hypothetical protein VF043_25115 [Ktedonobacteraceae bacterium]
MQTIRRTTSGRGALFARFVLFARFSNHWMAGPGLGMKAFGASRRFSAPLRRSSRRAQLVQKGRHGPSHLRQARNRVAGLPRAIAALQQRTRQQIVRAGDQVRPAFGALWGTQPWSIPEQLLFVKALAMLLRVAQAIRRADLGQWSRALALPDKPTDLGVPRLATGAVADDLDHAHLQRARRAQVQVAPTAHLDPCAFGVEPFPGLIRLAVAALVLALKALPILAAGSQLTGKTRRGSTVEDAIAFDPQQAARLDVGQARQEGRAGVPAVAKNDGMQAASPQQGHHRTQLAGRHLGGQVRRSDARRVQDEGALPGLGGQEHHVTHHPARAGGVCVLGHIGDGHQRPSAAVSASGRYRLLVSTPTNTSSPAAGKGAKSTKTWRSRAVSIWPSSKASYKLAQLRSKNGENDNSGKLLAAASLASASTRLNRASLAWPKQAYIP